MARTLSIIGAGRVGKTLAKRLRALGWRIGAVVTRSEATARAAVRFISAGTAYAMPVTAAGPSLGPIRASGRNLHAPRSAARASTASQLSVRGSELPLRQHAAAKKWALAPEDKFAAILVADVILVSTPDDLMPAVVEVLARAGDRGWRGKVVLHTSGALDRSVLAPLERLGAATGSLHPMQTFSGRNIPKLAGVTFAIEGEGRARRTALSLARLLGGSPVVVASGDKPVYHATASLAAGSGFALMETSIQILERIGFTRRRALETLLPLVRQMLDNIERLGPRAAWTGPLSRGDYAVVGKHVQALRRYPREFQQAYAALAHLAGHTLASNPAAARKQIDLALKSSEKNSSRRNRS